MEAEPENLDMMAEKVDVFQPVNMFIPHEVEAMTWFLVVSLVLVLITRYYMMSRTVIDKSQPKGGAARRLKRKPGERRKSLVMGKQGTAEMKQVSWFGIVIGGIVTGGTIAFFFLF